MFELFKKRHKDMDLSPELARIVRSSLENGRVKWTALDAFRVITLKPLEYGDYNPAKDYGPGTEVITKDFIIKEIK